MTFYKKALVISISFFSFLAIGENDGLLAQQNPVPTNSVNVSKSVQAKINKLKVEKNKAVKSKDYEEAMRLNWQLAPTYENIKLSGVAVQLYEEAIDYAKKSNSKKNMAMAYHKLGDYYPDLKYYQRAKENYVLAKSIYRDIEDWNSYGIILRKLGKNSFATKDYDMTMEVCNAMLEDDQEIRLSFKEREEIYLRLIKIHNKQDSPAKARLYATLLEEIRADQANPQRSAKEKYERIKNLDLTMLSKEEAKKMESQINDLQKKLRNQEKEINKHKQEIKEKDIVLTSQEEKILKQQFEKVQLARENENNKRLAISIISVILLASGVIIVVIKRSNNKLALKNAEIEAQKAETELQRRKSDDLLLNILPYETANELKETGYSSPKYYEKVTVLFTDFKGFTQISEKLSPKEIVEELNKCFLKFDEIVEKYNLEKIKTIGDAYMCAGGVPVENETNPIDAVLAGLEMQRFMDEWKQQKIAANEPYFELRLGIHTGALVAGVVGKKKFAYDIWGDTVNLASRMESSGEVGCVNISGATYETIKEFFECEYRGKISAKNKGEVDMYFVQTIKKMPPHIHQNILLNG